MATGLLIFVCFPFDIAALCKDRCILIGWCVSTDLCAIKHSDAYDVYLLAVTFLSFSWEEAE
jgi:hypothetical protein